MFPQSSLFVSKFCKEDNFSKRFILQNLLIKISYKLKNIKFKKFNKSIPFESQTLNNSNSTPAKSWGGYHSKK
jgi:hypothetical protein